MDFALWLAVIGVLDSLLPSNQLGEGVFLVLLFLTYWGYPIVCEVCWRGQTIGKYTLGLEVRRADGLPVGWRESVLRNLLLVVDFLPFMYATGLITMLIDGHSRRLGDIVAGTEVVYREDPQKRSAPPTVTPEPTPYPLTPEQQAGLLSLFERERSLPPARLAELGTIAEPFTGLRETASLEKLRAYAAGLSQ
jgi:uncharacterized RDD family membrane protein YckC